MDMSGHPLFPTEFALHIFVELHCTISWVIMYEEFVDKICARYGMVAVYLCAVWSGWSWFVRGIGSQDWTLRGMKWFELICPMLGVSGLFCARYEVAGVDLCAVWSGWSLFVRGMKWLGLICAGYGVSGLGLCEVWRWDTNGKKCCDVDRVCVVNLHCQ